MNLPRLSPRNVVLGALGAWVFLRFLKGEDKDSSSSAPALPPHSVFGPGLTSVLTPTARLTTRPRYEPNPNPLPVPQPQPQGPQQIPLRSDLVAVPGQFYRATLELHAPASWIANADKVRREAEKAGFTNVTVNKKPPPGWPGLTGDYHVSATYSGAGETFTRSHGGGQVQITDVWRG